MGCVQQIKKLLKSEKLHKIIITLVVIDCLIVALELLLYELGKYVLHSHAIDANCNKQNKVSITNFTSNNAHSHLKKHEEKADLFFEITEKILKGLSTGILSLFMVEILFKLVFDPRVFKSKWEILDAFVVLCSLSLNIVLFFLSDDLEAVSGLFVLLRLWRIGEIVNGTIMAIEKGHEAKVEGLKEHIHWLEEENQHLKDQMNKRNLINNIKGLVSIHCRENGDIE